MPQMLATQPAVPQAPPKASNSGTHGNKEQSRFSPHLDNAISSNRQQQTATDKSTNKPSSSTEDGKLTDGKGQSLESQKSEDNQNYLQTAATEDAAAEKEDLEGINLTPLHTETTQPAPEKFAFSRPQQIAPTAVSTQNTSTALANEMNTDGKFSGSSPIQSELPDLPPASTEPLVQNVIKPVTGSKQDALISQLQHIIDNAEEAGTVSITKVGNNPAPNTIGNPAHGITNQSFSGNSDPIIVTAAAEATKPHVNGLLVADADGIETNSGKSTQQLTGLRQDNQQQYYNAKIHSQNLAENNQGSQGNQQGGEFSQQATVSSPQNGSLGPTEQTNTFSQISGIAQENTTQTITESAKPITLPSGTMVHEEEILKQVTERFQISGKHMDSRINLKLHPVELGELKIDLTVKEGSIRANVVAQSQHTLEILEKNISKLKTVLENQGFAVDQISVTAESESVGDFDLFDQHFFNQNDYTPTVSKDHQEDEAVFTLEDSEYAASEMTTGVNVKI